jgi:hypothetical protein
MEIFEERTVVQNILPPAKTKAEHQSDFDLFLNHFKLILEHQEIILNTPKYFQILLERFHVGTSITGIAYIPLGVLLLLWRDEELICQCPECNGNSYIFQAGGSLLSGDHRYTAICPECKRCFCGRASSFGEIYSPICSILKKYPNTETILKRRTTTFSWGQGLVGKPTPDEVIDSGIPTIEFKSLIKLLDKALEGRG